MKEITNEIKRKILALYLEQPVLVEPAYTEKKAYKLTANRLAVDAYTESMYLLLKPLSSISDEDALDAIKIVKCYVRKDGAFITEHSNIKNIVECFIDVPIWRLDVADFLRTKGYALPYLHWNVDELVQAGVFKLKTTDN